MSLKDRLNTTQKQQTAKPEQEKQPQYFNSNEDANNFDTLGIIDTLLIDDELNSVFVSGAKNIYVNKRGKVHKSTTTYRDNVQLENILKKAAIAEGIEPIGENACFKFNHKLGINVTATLPPMSNVATMFIKCYKDKHANLQALQEEHSVSKEISLVLEALCTIKKNILIIGEKNTLKTTLLSALAKKMPTNNRAFLVDNEKEIKIDFPNYTSYNFINLNEETCDRLFASMVLSSPDKIFINDDSIKILPIALKYMQKGYRGVITALEATNIDEAIEKSIKASLKNDSTITKEQARAMFLSAFDIIIKVKRDEIGRRQIASISQINLMAQDEFVEEIFTIDALQEHKSTGIIPIFFEDIKNNSLPIADNVFDSNYKHTYYKGYSKESINQYSKKSANIDILKKFKKELPMQEENEMQENASKQNDVIENNPSNLADGDLMQKAQEKFNELKKNAQLQEEFDEAVENFAKEETHNE